MRRVASAERAVVAAMRARCAETSLKARSEVREVRERDGGPAASSVRGAASRAGG